MITKLIASVLVAGLLFGTVVITSIAAPYGHSYGKPYRGLLGQLPANKEMLFHQTMRDARDKSSKLNEEIRKLRGGMRELLAAAEFDGASFNEKADRVRQLRNARQKIMSDAIVALAGKFSQDERKVLARLISKHPTGHGAMK